MARLRRGVPITTVVGAALVAVACAPGSGGKQSASTAVVRTAAVVHTAVADRTLGTVRDAPSTTPVGTRPATVRPVIYVTITGEAPTDEPLPEMALPNPADTVDRPTPSTPDPYEMPVPTPTPQ